MTKIIAKIGPHRFTNLYLPMMLPLEKIADGFCVWNFEFGSLGFVW